MSSKALLFWPYFHFCLAAILIKKIHVFTEITEKSTQQTTVEIVLLYNIHTKSSCY